MADPLPRMFPKCCRQVPQLALGVVFSFLFGGCAVFLADNLPTARPPDKICTRDNRNSSDRDRIDRDYGYPIAFKVEDNGHVMEQIQFADGVSENTKRSRICLHYVLDYCTICLWELVATPFELCTWAIGYPTYVYFLEFDTNGKLVRAVNADSAEGQGYRKQPWTIPVEKGVAKNGLAYNDSPNVHNAMIDEIVRKTFAGDIAIPGVSVADSDAKSALYELTSLRRDKKNGFYHFVLKVTAEKITIETIAATRRELYKEIVADYAESKAIKDRSMIRADLVKDLNFSNRQMEGVVAVFSAEPVALMDYNHQSRKGRITVRFDVGVEQEVARKWAVKKIETLARDKNILLTTGAKPPEGNYRSLGEEWRGNELEIKFKIE